MPARNGTATAPQRGRRTSTRREPGRE